MVRRRSAVVAAPALAALILAAPPAAAQRLQTERGPLAVETVAQGLDHPWGMAFLPDGRLLVSERPGRLRVVARDGALSAPLGGLPAVHARGQGGLLDVALGPDFERSRLVYFSFSEPGEGGAGTAVARGRLGEGGLDGVEVIFRQQPKVEGPNHWGSRLVFAPDGTLFVTLGERYQRNRSQNLHEHLGKLIRINPDGSVPRDNPFVGRGDARPEIYSFGHRNVQAAALHPETRRLWIVDHGARGGDEINLPEPGRNYGWPIITYGRDYSGAPIGEGTAKPGLEQPVHYWDPSIAPSGMAFYTGAAFPGWRGNLLVGGLRSQALFRLELDGARVARQEEIRIGERVRDVRQGPDGLVYLLTDESRGRLLRLSPG